MKFTIKHEKKGRIRVHLFQKYMNFTQADTLQYYLENLDGVKKAQVFNRTSDALIYYTGERNELLKAILVRDLEELKEKIMVTRIGR